MGLIDTIAIRARLLHHIRQLMGYHSPPFVRFSPKPIRTKHDIVSDRVGMRINIFRRLLGGCPGMHSHPGKVMPEALFHVLPYSPLHPSPPPAHAPIPPPSPP